MGSESPSAQPLRLAAEPRFKGLSRPRPRAKRLLRHDHRTLRECPLCRTRFRQTYGENILTPRHRRWEVESPSRAAESDACRAGQVVVRIMMSVTDVQRYRNDFFSTSNMLDTSNMLGTNEARGKFLAKGHLWARPGTI